ncbi:MAG: GIY-YIG nuclease family protein [Proteobacteria bacterium]|nr:GIY-YIG nuclease family protein [Desulfocapsa sp.]MBU3944235.1 GIY-YIG nuclease family protein [Pseudomonadota bacterium]MCG2743786.1 GIY-YIG nuclease family protein [Desulfobacteraceae bacterium]MBU4028836.1 GIY-YIG nuclease family protein [Pseudomonadota bacterium]MBU4041740.1 GIY-YIG nuclease family protein [Pseudomonadota bacterium]
MDSWYVYIVQCGDNSLYTGITKDLEKRILEHNSGPKGAKYTRSRRPVALVYSEEATSRSAATSREHHIKKLKRWRKGQLVAQGNRQCSDHP